MKNTLSSNLTACVTISKYQVEGLQFLHKVQRKLNEDDASKLKKAKGQKNEIFVFHLQKLIPHLKQKYPNKVIIIQMDNLKAHISKLVHELMDTFKGVIIFFGSSQTPEFSAIECLFATLKKDLKFYKHRNHLETAKKV